MKITVNILVKNNESTIEQTLNSIYELGSNIVIGNLNSNDKTISICKKFNTKIIELGNLRDISKAKNKLIQESKTSWMLFIEPWERLFSPIEKLQELFTQEVNSYKINVLQNDIITKQIRLWHKNKCISFGNPVFESIKDKSSKYSDIYFISNGSFNYSLEAIESWRDEKPLSCEPLYYLAFYYLKQKEWNKFLGYAKLYLSQEKNNNISLVMTHYYCAMIRCYIESEKNIQEALSHIVYCISEHPVMSEFWCLLGDIYHLLNDYEKAKCFYENALIIGSKRLKNDDLPMEISKYKEYPDKMIANCNLMLANLRTYKINKESQVH